MALLSALLLAALCPGQPAQEPAAEAAPPAIQVAVDPRVELLSIVFRLAGNPEYQRQEFRRYAAAIERHFGGFRDHPAVVEARRLRATRGVSYDAVMSLAVHLDGVPLLRPRLRFEDSLLESRWRPEEARAFLGLLRSFVEDTGFEAFLAGKAELYALAEWRMRRLIEEEVELDWFEGFFGAAPEASFHVLIGLGNGPSNYGPKFRGADGAEQLYAVLGTWLLDEEGDPLFDESLVGTLVHEFNHSFVNHHVYAHEAELRAAGERLYPLVEQAMRRQAYGSWQTMMHESLVR
nr:DUF4932 domain-containing protein [Planctomycetota bacterium]